MSVIFHTLRRHLTSHTMAYKSGTEVEIKLALGDAANYAKAAALFERVAAGKYDPVVQRNVFFDGSNNEILSTKSACRIRFHGENATVTVKSRSVVKDGVGRASETEEDIPYDLALRVEQDPSSMLSLADSFEIFKLVRDTFHPTAMKSLGGFKNVRTKFDWNNQTIELDQTHYDFGTSYEIELECDRPEEIKPQLEALLREAGVEFKDESTTKFHRFLLRKL